MSSNRLDSHTISDEDENFNPLERDFNDPKFNSYKSGPGSYINPQLHTQKRWKEGDKGYKLFVSDIPLGIKDSGFQNIFANFGAPQKMYLQLAKSNKCKWGFVEYKTLREAERAIYCVNRVPPLNLSVKFAITDEAKENRSMFRDETPASAIDDLPQFKATTDHKGHTAGRGRGLPLPLLQGIRPGNVTSFYYCYTPYISLYSEPTHSHPSGEFSHHSGDEIIDSYNEAMTYVKPVMKSNEKCLIYMGRGYAIKELIDHSERYVAPVKKVYSFSNEESCVNCQCQPCSLCQGEAMRICFNCCRWYCSKLCFRADSPNHIIDVSGLVLCYKLQNVDPSKSESETCLRSSKSQVSDRGVFVKKLIFPPLKDEIQDGLNKSSSLGDHSCPTSESTRPIGNRNAYLKETHFIRYAEEFDNGNISTSSQHSLNDSLKAGEISNSFSCKTSNQLMIESKCASHVSLPPDHPLEIDKYTLVKICVHVCDFTYWVNRLSDMCEVFDITKLLFKHCRSSDSSVLEKLLPSINCAAFSNGFWYRAKILAVDNKDVRLLLIDYGREEICSAQKLKNLPKEMLNMPPLAFKIQFASGTPAKYKDLTDQDEISVKPVSMDADGSVIVHAENELYQSVLSLTENTYVSSPEVDGPLPFNVFTEVVIAFNAGKSEYWVNLLSKWDELNQMSDVLNMIGDRAKPVTKPVLNEVYIKFFYDSWCRAKVISLDPLTVFYVDYGNEEKVNSVGDLRLLPSMLTHRVPPLALKIRLAEGANEYATLKSPAQIKIKPIAKDEATYIVIIQGEDGSDTGSNTSIDKSLRNQSFISNSLNHLLFATEGCKRFDVVVNQVMSKDRFCGSLNFNSRRSNVKVIEDEISNLSQGFTDNMKLGDQVACLSREGLCARGYITSIIEDTKRVALVDYAFVAIADKLCAMPASLYDIPEVGVSCSLSRPLTDIQVGSKIRCSQAKLRGNHLYCESENYGSLVISVWTPRMEDGGLPSVTIPSGSRVIISSYRTPQAIYVQSLESKHRELFETLIQDVAAYSATASKLNRDPEIGEVVACLFQEDQNFYRAQVYRKKGNLFSVNFIDFGNSFDVSLQDMRILDDHLKIVPCSAVKIGLKGVNESILNGICVHYLNLKCAKDNEFLFLEYDDNLKLSTLKTKDGESLNNKIDSMISLNWKKCLEEGVDPTNGLVFFGDDVTYVLWDVGSKVKLTIVAQISANSYFVINSQDGLLDFIRDVFTPRVSEYCNSFTKHYSYTPRLREICFVKLQDDNQWYRAVVTNTFEISCWVVFLDFGNRGEVYFKNVRPMTDEFIRVPSILKRCIIQGLPDEYPNENAKKRLNEILIEGSVHSVIITKETSKGVVTAYFNNISALTNEIGLPPIPAPK